MPPLFLATADYVQPGTRLPVVEVAPVVCDMVLVVEDDPAVAMLLERVLARINQRVLLARDGGECRRLFEENQATIALVFMDCGLPDVHGGSLCRELRASVPGLPVLLTSGREQPGLLALLAADGPTAFLPKPYLPGEVMRQVQAILAVKA